MGFLYYGATQYAVEVEDRTLAHLKIAILTMLRAGQSVALSFVKPTDAGSGRETIWICPSTDVRFEFLGSRPPRVNQAWVRMLIESANAPTGMHITEEPAEERLEERVAS